MHLAQLNIGRLRGEQGDPHMESFFESLGPVNAVAEKMPGFIWRLKDETGNATTVRWPGDDSVVANLTVWRDIESLEKFVWQTVHARIYNRKHEWFEKPTGPTFVMWWIPARHRPTLIEAKERLKHLAQHGSSEFAFAWEAAPSAKLWKEKRCA